MGKKAAEALEINYDELADYLHKAQPGTKFIAVAQKGYVAESIAAVL